MKLRTTVVEDQDDVAPFELPTDGYTLVDLYVDYHLPVQNSELILFLKGNNLLDEEIRNHSSFVKIFSPEPGIGAQIGLRYNF